MKQIRNTEQKKKQVFPIDILNENFHDLCILIRNHNKQKINSGPRFESVALFK